MKAFVATYRSFTDPETLFSRLLHRFHAAAVTPTKVPLWAITGYSPSLPSHLNVWLFVV
jgi:hypothetical protein